VQLLNPQIAQDLAQGVALKLDLGSGGRPRPGAYAVDHIALPGVDIVADLNEPLDLLPDDCAEYVFSSHALEHVRELLPLLAEIHRVTRPGGLIELVVPHFSNPFHYSDPTHVRFFGLYTMSYFVETGKQPHRRKVPAFYTPTRFEIESVKIAFYRFNLLDRIVVPILRYLVNRTPGAQEFYEFRLARRFPAAELRYRLRPSKAARAAG
jgi:SAM-dependent methyltransferase